jgi:hypothetical protein
VDQFGAGVASFAALTAPSDDIEGAIRAGAVDLGAFQRAA